MVSDINLIQIDGIKNVVPHIVVIFDVILKTLYSYLYYNQEEM